MQIQHLRKAATIVSDILLKLERLSVPNTLLSVLEDETTLMIKKAGATSCIKDYKPHWAKEKYPSVLCACVNEEVVHCPPGEKVLKEGDIVTYDLGIAYKGVKGDAAITVPVGAISNRKQRLLRYSKGALLEGIDKVKAGVAISEIGKVIDTYSSRNGYNVFRTFCGHHIGKEMHELPLIPNFEDSVNHGKLEEGKVICIEPTLTPGKEDIVLLADNWTTKSIDNQPCAMFEAMVLVKKDGFEVLTHHI
ncbi:MAG: type I methionyl aminopeptidase [Nanoarchaeota archaeon]|nr:type I methionyl aminopeptidase [Nanoarchaeota archaeon]